MQLENLKYDFPVMPEEMRRMVENEVNKQINKETVPYRRSKKMAKRVFAASIAAVMLLGTTVFAGISAYRMQQEKTGEHGVEVTMSAENDSNQAGLADSQAVSVIPNVKMQVGYLPEGMVETEEGKYSFSETLYQGGVSICFYRMDMGDDKFEIKHGDVVSSEDINVSGHKGVYVQLQKLNEDDITFNQKIYVAYTDVHYIMEMFIASDVTKEEAVKIAENISLTSTEETEGIIHAWNWSEYLASLDEMENAVYDEEEEVTVTKDEMKNTHAIGDTFSAEQKGLDEYKGLMVKVSDVQISDDISLLDPDLTDEELKNETDENNKLLPAKIQYIKEGDENSLTEEIKSREVAQKLVYVTVEYTNTGEKELTDVLFYGDLVRIREENGIMHIYDGFSYEKPQAQDTWTVAENRGISRHQEMYYYDVFGGERYNNYIKHLAPNETVTVHMGWVVTEEELDKLYLSLDTYGGANSFSESSLEMGYVDLRQ